MTTTLNDFIAQVKTVGMARTNRFSVELTPPLKALGNESLKNILLFCDQVQVPGLNIATIQNRSYGEFREVPYEKLYGDIQMSFYVDNDLAVKTLFDNWMGLIQNPTSRTFGYYKDYVTEMKIHIQDVGNNLRHTTTMYEVYPKTIAPIQLDYASKEVMKLQVTMMYKYWKISPAGGSFLFPDNVSTGTNNNLVKDFLIPESYFNDFNNYQQDWNNTQKEIRTAGLGLLSDVFGA